MGMYTEFVIEVKLKKDTPCEILERLQEMVSDTVPSDSDNDLFPFERNPLMNFCGSNEYPASLDNLVLKAHGEIKNYGDDIQRFVDFIRPYVEQGFLEEDGAFAKSLYEDADGEWDYYFVV